MNKLELKEFLDSKVIQYNNPKFIESDPIQIPHRYTLKEDIEMGITDLEKFRALKDKFGAEIRYNNDLHAKMVILDSSVAIISSANLTKKGLFVNYEAGICLKDANMVNKVAQFFNEMWKESEPLTQQAIKNVLSNEKW